MSTRKLAQLRRRLKRAGITFVQVAEACRPSVTPSHVSHVLAGRFTSRKVLDVAARLAEQAEASAAVPGAGEDAGAA